MIKRNLTHERTHSHKFLQINNHTQTVLHVSICSIFTPITSPPSDEIDSIEGIGELDRSGDDGADDHDGDDEKRLGGDQGLRAWCGV